jgi:hypothetical protein
MSRRRYERIRFLPLLPLPFIETRQLWHIYQLFNWIIMPDFVSIIL